MALAETGTRGLLGATLGSRTDRDETGLARRLLHLLGPGMVGVLDRAFDSNAFLAEIAATGAVPLARAKSTRAPLVLRPLPDGSYLSCLDGLDVRIVEASVVMTGADGSRIADSYRLITTLADHRAYPADALVRLYHERWEIESAYLALGHTLLDGRVLRAGLPPGVKQELWALLTVYQLLRMAMVTAVETRPGTNPDRASFTTALETARDQLTAAQGIWPDDPADLAGVIGRAVLSTLLPARRPRFSARKVKCAPPPSLTPGARPPPAVTVIPGLGAPARPPPLDDPATRASKRRPHRRTSALIRPQRPTRRDLITAINERRSAQGLARHRTRRPAPRQDPQPAHPARRMDPARLLHPHRLRHLRTQHASQPSILDKRARPLTTRHCCAIG